MNILGIETSCDETAVAIVNDKKEIKSEFVLSQSEHSIYGGVVPEVAARAHLEHIDKMVKETLNSANMNFADLDAVAVTAGPGLIGGVMVGVMTAKAICASHNLPCIAVNHLEGHALTPRLTDDVKFPYLLLLLSGGHSQILAVEGVGKYKKLGSTLDDALGEAFDKTAKLLGLGYPGGPKIEKLAEQCQDIKAATKKFPLPKPLMGRDGADFSFSGLKTAVRLHIEKFGDDVPMNEAIDLCAAFQHTLNKVLQNRTQNAINIFKEIYGMDQKSHLVVSGGVAANKLIRQALQDLSTDNDMLFSAPPIRYCGDNAVMIAWAGIERFSIGISDELDFKARPRWPLDPDN